MGAISFPHCLGSRSAGMKMIDPPKRALRFRPQALAHPTQQHAKSTCLSINLQCRLERTHHSAWCFFATVPTSSNFVPQSSTNHTSRHRELFTIFLKRSHDQCNSTAGWEELMHAGTASSPHCYRSRFSSDRCCCYSVLSYFIIHSLTYLLNYLLAFLLP